MKLPLLLVALSGFALVSASPPADPIPWEDEKSLSEYPRCSATVKDRCIQSNERTARASETRSSSSSMASAAPAAADKPKHSAQHAAADYPPCSSTVTDRCIQTGSPGSAVRMARSAPKPKHQARHMQLAMRAGERG